MLCETVSVPDEKAATTTSSQQFFPTNSQRIRRKKRKDLNEIGPNIVGNKADIVELRRQFILKEQENYDKEHSAKLENQRLLQAERMRAITTENKERLAEIRERRQFQKEIHAKKLQFWQAAIAAIENESEAPPAQKQRIAMIVDTVKNYQEDVTGPDEDQSVQYEYLEECDES